MNSDFEYKKTCQHCGKTFIAQKATTKYCSIQCSRHAFKEQCRNKRLEDESTRILESRRLKMAMKEYLLKRHIPKYCYGTQQLNLPKNIISRKNTFLNMRTTTTFQRKK